VLTKEEFLQSIRDSQESSVLLYVHGFATKFDDALYRLAQIKYDTAYDGIPIAFCWPSRGEMNLIDYNHDRDSVIASTNAFSELLQLLHTTAHVSKIYIVAHSMGSQVVVNSIAGSSDARKIPLAELVLAAPDISWEVFRAAAQQLTDAVKKVTLYASTTDQALRFSDTWNGAQTPRAGLLLSGTHQNVPSDIETIDVSALGADMFGFAVNHDIPFRARSALGDVGRLLRYGIHPPNDRSPGEILGVPEGSTHPEYWIFPK
jgi:esterase/lipase superfamily enzyme